MQQQSEEEEGKGKDENKVVTVAKELLEGALKALFLLPVDLEAVKDTNMARFLTILQTPAGPTGDGEASGSGGGGQIAHAVTSKLAQVVTDKWAEYAKSSQHKRHQEQAAAAAAVAAIVTASPAAAVPVDITGATAVATGNKPSKTFPQQPAGDLSVKRPRQVTTEETEAAADAKAKRIDLRKRGQGGGIQVVAGSPIASSPSSRDKGEENYAITHPAPQIDSTKTSAGATEEGGRGAAAEATAQSIVARPPSIAPAAGPSIHENPKKKKAVRWRDQHGEGELREVFIFVKKAFETIDDEKDGHLHPMGGSWTELAKREHLNERDALRNKGGMSGGGGSGSSSSSMVCRVRAAPPVTAISWHIPPRLAEVNPLPEVESSEITVQNSRTRLSIERRYLHKSEIPVTPQEDSQVVTQPVANADQVAMLEVIPWVVGAAAEKRQNLAQVATPPAPPSPPPQQQQQQQQQQQHEKEDEDEQNLKLSEGSRICCNNNNNNNNNNNMRRRTKTSRT
eukprot:evm.model.NODE_5931_length_8511_cov_32.465752.3